MVRTHACLLGKGRRPNAGIAVRVPRQLGVGSDDVGPGQLVGLGIDVAAVARVTIDLEGDGFSSAVVAVVLAQSHVASEPCMGKNCESRSDREDLHGGKEDGSL